MIGTFNLVICFFLGKYFIRFNDVIGGLKKNHLLDDLMNEERKSDVIMLMVVEVQ